VGLHDFAAQAQAQAVAAGFFDAGFVDSVEGFEDPLLLDVGNTDAEVLDVDQDVRRARLSR